MKKTKNKISNKIPADFWKGLLVGVSIAAIGMFAYFEFFPTMKFPPTNNADDKIYCDQNCYLASLSCDKKCGEDNACKKNCDHEINKCFDKCASLSN